MLGVPATSPRAFWARRQAHETAIHRADAESALATVPEWNAAFAADLTVAGPARDVYLLLWNRGGADHLDVQGDPAVLRLWRERARVSWS